MALCARQGNEEKAPCVILVLLVTNEQVGGVEAPSVGPLVPGGVVGVDKIDAIELKAL